MWRQFSFWRRSAAVSAASLDGVSPFEARRGGALRLACCRHPAGGKEAIAQERNNCSPIILTTMPCQRDAGSTLSTYGRDARVNSQAGRLVSI